MDERLAQLSPEQRRLFELRKAQMQRRDEDRKCLLTLQEGDAALRPPLFCLHPPLGVTGYYSNIVRHLPPEQPAYGIQNPHFVGIGEPLDTVEAMAARYLEVIASVAPQGPYLLAGHSSGAYVAYEMARQLEDAGASAPLVLVIDAMAPMGPVPEPMPAFRVPNVVEDVPAIFLCCWLVSLGYNAPLTFSMEELLALPTLQVYERVADYLRSAGFLPQNSGSEMVPVVLRCVAASAHADVAYHDQHTPGGTDRPYAGRLVVLRCTEETVFQGLGVTLPPDTSEAANWEHFCSRAPEVIGIPGTNHVTLVLEPHCRDLAAAIGPYLDEFRRSG